MYLVLSWLGNALALIITDWLLPGISIFNFSGNFLSWENLRVALLATLVIGLINTFIRPVLLFLTAPLNFLTLGLFTFVVNAIVLYIASWIFGPQFRIDSFWWAIIAAAVLSIVSTVIASLIKDLVK